MLTASNRGAAGASAVRVRRGAQASFALHEELAAELSVES